MTKFNQALIAAASSIALFAGALTLITPAANAATRCTHNDFLGTSTWSGPGGTVRGTQNDFLNTTSCY